MKRRIWPSSPRRCWRKARKRPSISVISAGRLAAELAISRTLLVCFWKAFGNRTLTDIGRSRQDCVLTQFWASFVVFLHKGFKVAEPGTDGQALLIGPVQAIGGLEAVAGDAGDGEFVGVDAAVGIEPGGDRRGHAAGRLGKDALGLRKFLDGGDDFHVRYVLGPAAGGADGAHGIRAVGGVADGQRPRDGVGPLRLDDVCPVLDGGGDRRAARGLRSEEADWLFLPPPQGDPVAGGLAGLCNQGAARPA